MQAQPAASPIVPVTPVTPANVPATNGPVANPSTAKASPADANSAAPPESGQSNPASFQQVLATQMDAESLRPELVLEAANADLADPAEEAIDPLAAIAQDAAAAAQLLAPTAPMVRPDTLPQEGLDSESEMAAQGIARAGAASDAMRADAQREGELVDALQSGTEQIKATGSKGLDSELQLRLAGPQEHGNQSHTTQGLTEGQRAPGTLKSLDSANFNPRVIPEPVKSPQWSEALGQRVVWMSRENVQVVYIQVEPPNLGPLEVQLRFSNDQANLLFASAHSSVRDAISNSLPKLDELLAAGGVSLGSVSVDTQAPSQDPRQQADGSRAHSPEGDWEFDTRTGEAMRPARPLIVGLVDTFA